MGVRHNSLGPLAHAVLVQIGDTDAVVFWDRTEPPVVDATDRDEDYLIEMADRHDLLADRKVGASAAGWIINERNNDVSPEEIDLRLWPNDYVPGRKIKIPPRDSLSSRGIV